MNSGAVAFPATITEIRGRAIRLLVLCLVFVASGVIELSGHSYFLGIATLIFFGLGTYQAGWMINKPAQLEVTSERMTFTAVRRYSTYVIRDCSEFKSLRLTPFGRGVVAFSYTGPRDSNRLSIRTKSAIGNLSSFPNYFPLKTSELVEALNRFRASPGGGST